MWQQTGYCRSEHGFGTAPPPRYHISQKGPVAKRSIFVLSTTVLIMSNARTHTLFAFCRAAYTLRRLWEEFLTRGVTQQPAKHVCQIAHLSSLRNHSDKNSHHSEHNYLHLVHAYMFRSCSAIFREKN
jgi:hypothetical protein